MRHRIYICSLPTVCVEKNWLYQGLFSAIFSPSRAALAQHLSLFPQKRYPLFLLLTAKMFLMLTCYYTKNIHPFIIFTEILWYNENRFIFFPLVFRKLLSNSWVLKRVPYSGRKKLTSLLFVHHFIQFLVQFFNRVDPRCFYHTFSYFKTRRGH